MKVIGLTGGMGTGKSTVAAILRKLGAYIIDADEISRRVVRGGQKSLEELKANFGPEIINLQGELDRKKLASIVFEDRSKLAVLNKIVHEEVHKEMWEELTGLTADKFDGIVILDVPIPTEQFRKMSDEIWVVDADLKIRLERVKRRNVISEEEALKRINAQMTREEYLSIGDKIINNTGSEKDLELEVKRLYEESSAL